MPLASKGVISAIETNFDWHFASACQFVGLCLYLKKY